MVTLPSSLVGRERERERLAAALAEAGQAGAGLAVVTGPPGIGKTALVRDLADRSGRRSLWARCVPWEANLPFGVVGQLLQPADLPSDPAGDPLSDPLAVAAFLAEWIGTSPTLITVDAAEHADRPSLRALSSLVRQHRCVPVFIAVTATFSPGPPELAGLGHEIELSGLDATAIGELARMHGRIPHPAVVERLRRHTAGNPRDLLGLLDELPDARWAAVNQALPAPRHVMAQTRENLAGCGAGGRALVEAFAILESAADGIGETGLAEAIALAGIADPFAAQDEATGSGLLTSRIAGEPHLVNPMIRAAVLESLGAVRRAELHDKASRVVSDPARRLRHRVATTDLPDAALAGELDTVATECSARGEWGAAAKLLWEASQLTTESLPRDDRLVRSFDAMVADGDILAATSLVPALESLRETPRRDAALGYLAVIRGRAAEADARLRRAWDIVNTDRDPQVAAQIAQRCTLHMLSRCRGAELVRWADTAVRLVGPDSPAGLEAAAIRGLGLAADGRSDEAERAYLALAARVPHGAQAQRIAMGHGWLQLGEDDLDAARSSLESAVSTAFLGGSARIALWAHGWLARVQFLTGEWPAALRTVAAGRDLARRTGIVLATPLLNWTAAQVHALSGDWNLAESEVRDSETITESYEIMRVPCHIARAQLAEARADYAAVLRCLEPLTRMPSDTNILEPGVWTWTDTYGNALVVRGQYADAERFLTDAERTATARVHRSTLARLGYVRGRLHGALGDLPSARAAFTESLALLDDLPLRYDRARVNFAFGQTLRRAGRRREAEAVITTARELYLGLGAQAYVRRCDRELHAGGGRVPREQGSPDRLTPQEEAVSSLVARGLSNREIAAELYLSPKTVQFHLTRVYAKLGIRSRTELASLRSGTT